MTGVLSVPRLPPGGSRDRLRPPHDPAQDEAGMKTRWMNGRSLHVRGGKRCHYSWHLGTLQIIIGETQSKVNFPKTNPFLDAADEFYMKIISVSLSCCMSLKFSFPLCPICSPCLSFLWMLRKSWNLVQPPSKPVNTPPPRLRTGAPLLSLTQ